MPKISHELSDAHVFDGNKLRPAKTGGAGSGYAFVLLNDKITHRHSFLSTSLADNSVQFSRHRLCCKSNNLPWFLPHHSSVF